jgi:8-oxo-dGDP phosphatase
MSGVEDSPDDRRVVSRREAFTGNVIAVRTDQVDLGGGHLVTRDVVVHPGAVGVVALDEKDQVLLIRQYRHPVRASLWEVPAGLLDITGENPAAAAARELHEEAGYSASSWNVLVDSFTSPGGSTEALRCYLARGLTQVADEFRYRGHDEERDMPMAWVPLDEVKELVLTGRLHNPTTVTGVLAAWASRGENWLSLRPADDPWPEHDRLQAGGGATALDIAAGRH